VLQEIACVGVVIYDEHANAGCRAQLSCGRW
jgi:hypothetical protein